MAVRAFTFDFWRTLFRDANGPARQQLRISALAQATGIPEPEVDGALRRTWAEFDRHHREEQQTLTPADAVNMACELLEVRLDADEVKLLTDIFATAILRHSAVPIAGALEAVREASGLLPCGVLSDSGVSPGSSLRALLEREGFLRYLNPDALVFSDEVGVSKPQRPMFEAAASRLGVVLDELLHVGDLEYTDVAGARACGARSVLFAGDNHRYVAGSRADFVVHGWREFVTKLPEMLA